MFTWSGSKMFLQHSASGIYPPLCSPFTLFCSPLHPLLSHVCSQLRLSSRREGTFRHMDLPFVYHRLDRGVADDGICAPIGCCSPTLNMIGFDLQRGWGGNGLKLGGDSWLLKQCFKGHRDGLRQRISNNDIPAKWPKWEALARSLFTLCSKFSS